MNPKIFFGELKRRNVYKVAVAYAARRDVGRPIRKTVQQLLSGSEQVGPNK
jgi:hypothetical protein